jgi:transcriptional regulator with XRE-family HTH domain
VAKTRKQLGEKLRVAREEAGLSQEQVAQHLNVPRPAISLVERGQRRVEALELARLAKLFKRSLSYFTDEEAGVDETSPQLQLLRRTTASLSEKDRGEVLRFAEFLRGRAGADDKQ